MDPHQVIEDADRLVDWANANGQPDKPITFPHSMKGRVPLEYGNKYRGHPVKFADPPRKVYGSME
jgi:hypothetical protein